MPDRFLPKIRGEAIVNQNEEIKGVEILCKRPLSITEDLRILKHILNHIKNPSINVHINILPKTLYTIRNIPLNGDMKRLYVEIVEEGAELKKLNKKIKELGINVVIDDFGTGYSSIDRVLQIENLKMVKIDRPLWKNMESLALKLKDELESKGVRVLAEKVEEKEEFTRLKSLGFKYFQGYLFEKQNREVLRWIL